jgi:hypothetical protein
MANSTLKQQLDLEDRALHEAATVLLCRTLAQLRAGDWFEVRGDSPQLVEQLAAWYRKEGRRCEPKLLPECTAYSRPDSRRQSPRRVFRFPKRPIRLGASPLVARASKAADPTSASPCARNRDVWARELNTYRQATAHQWSVGDFPENLRIKWRSHAGCGFNMLTMYFSYTQVRVSSLPPSFRKPPFASRTADERVVWSAAPTTCSSSRLGG